MTRIVRMDFASASVGGLIPTGYIQILKDSTWDAKLWAACTLDEEGETVPYTVWMFESTIDARGIVQERTLVIRDSVWTMNRMQ